jgi:hypothetical protein
MMELLQWFRIFNHKDLRDSNISNKITLKVCKDPLVIIKEGLKESDNLKIFNGKVELQASI